MTKESLIQHTLETIQKLPQSKILEVSDYADYILKKYDDEMLQNGIEKIVSESNTFNEIVEDDVIYTVNDIKELYK